MFTSRLLTLIFIPLLCTVKSAKPRQNTDTTYTYKTPDPDGKGKVYKGREIAQVMGFEGAAWLERNNREQEEDAKLAVSKLPIRENSVIADIGAGTGYYTFKIAPKVVKGKVYAVEIQDDAINYLKARSLLLKQNNVTVIKGGDQSPNLPDNSIDLVIMVDVYHELLYPHEMLQSIRKALKPKGKLLLLEYRAEDFRVAIKALHKMSVAQVNKELKANGFHLIQDGEFMPIQHFLIYQ